MVRIQKGMTYDEIYGKERAAKIRKAKSEAAKGKKPSKKTREKMSIARKGKRVSPATEFKKGDIPWNMGIPHTEEAKKKMRETALRLGTKPTKETIEAARITNKGKKYSLGKHHTKETKEKMSNAHTGEKNHFFGKHHSAETIEKMSGINNHNWKGGLSRERDIIKSKQEYKDWRKEVFRRDGYTCVRCLERGGDLNAHHILSFTGFSKERFKVDNGATLCVPCHKWVHLNEIST